MSFRSRRRNRREGRGVGNARGGSHAIGKSDAAGRWNTSTRIDSGRTMPRLGPVLLAIVVVGLLTAGLHVLFQ
jgi:hypothetical protein